MFVREDSWMARVYIRTKSYKVNIEKGYTRIKINYPMSFFSS